MWQGIAVTLCLAPPNSSVKYCSILSQWQVCRKLSNFLLERLWSSIVCSLLLVSVPGQLRGGCSHRETPGLQLVPPGLCLQSRSGPAAPPRGGRFFLSG